MSIAEIILIGIGLAMDATAVCLSAGMIYQGLTRRQKFSMPLAFAFFQGIMPVLGYFLGSLFAGIITKYSGIVAFIILGFICGSMIKDSLSDDDDKSPKHFTFKILMLQAVATSIDAFAVGVSFAATGASIVLSPVIIAAVTFVFSMAGIILGSRAGKCLGCKAEILGGAILIIIGLKSLLRL